MTNWSPTWTKPNLNGRQLWNTPWNWLLIMMSGCLWGHVTNQSPTWTKPNLNGRRLWNSPWNWLLIMISGITFPSWWSKSALKRCCLYGGWSQSDSQSLETQCYIPSQFPWELGTRQSLLLNSAENPAQTLLPGCSTQYQWSLGTWALYTLYCDFCWKFWEQKYMIFKRTEYPHLWE